MARKKNTTSTELETVKLDMMRMRFRRVLGETVPAHAVKKARKDAAKFIRSLENSEEKNA